MREQMTACFEFFAGKTPLLISIPHDGRVLPAAIAERMTERARELPDTDWHVAQLYEFATELGASIIKANHSRYVVDLNRASSDATLYEGRFTTGLCPVKTFDGDDIYLQGQQPDAREMTDRVVEYWQPYHDKILSVLAGIKENFSYALLWDAHSIPSEVPLLFDGVLPQLNFGTNDGQSCASDVIAEVVAAAGAAENFSIALDDRFKGGHITRQYGKPSGNVHSIQLELAQRCYMLESARSFDDERAAQLQIVLSKALQAFISSAASRYERKA